MIGSGKCTGKSTGGSTKGWSSAKHSPLSSPVKKSGGHHHYYSGGSGGSSFPKSSGSTNNNNNDIRKSYGHHRANKSQGVGGGGGGSYQPSFVGSNISSNVPSSFQSSPSTASWSPSSSYRGGGLRKSGPASSSSTVDPHHYHQRHHQQQGRRKSGSGSAKKKRKRRRHEHRTRCSASGGSIISGSPKNRENVPVEAAISLMDTIGSHDPDIMMLNEQAAREFSRTNMAMLKGTNADPEAFLQPASSSGRSSHDRHQPQPPFFLERQVNPHKIYKYMTDYMDQYYDLTEDRNPYSQWRENLDDKLYDTFAYVIPILCEQLCRDVLRYEPMVVTTTPDVLVFGDLHGNLNDLYFINKNFITAPKYANFKFIFLGDYVDRGSKSIETLIFLFTIKLINPKRFYLLRGNHEVSKVNKKYGLKCLVEHLYRDTYIKMPNVLARFVYESINQTFNNLPYGAVIRIRNQKGVFCCHGGVPNESYNGDRPWRIEELNRLAGTYKPHDMIPRKSATPEQSALNELLWNDPIAKPHGGKSKRLFYPNRKRGGHCSKFTEDAANRFLAANNCRLLIRGHQFHCSKERGYHYNFERKTLTVFSSSNYCGTEENNTGYVLITEDQCEPHMLRSVEESIRYQQFNHFELVTNKHKEVVEVLF